MAMLSKMLFVCADHIRGQNLWHLNGFLYKCAEIQQMGTYTLWQNNWHQNQGKKTKYPIILMSSLTNI